MSKRVQSVFTFLLLFGSIASFAQTQTLEGLSNFYKKALTPIYEGKEVKGYTLFYKADKADKKNDNYGLDFFDQNLQKVKSVYLAKERTYTHLLRSAYNGQAFSLYFYNSRTKTLEIDVLDRALNKVASKKMDKLSKVDMQIALQELQMTGSGDNKPISGLNLYAVPNKGFIRNAYTGMMKGFELEMYDNNLNRQWISGTNEESKDYESLLINEVTDKYILATIARRPNMMSKKLTFFMAAFDVQTGKKVMDKALEKENTEQLSLSSFSFDAENNDFMAIGEFYNPEDKVLVDRSQGFFIKRFSLNGEEKLAKFYNWKKDVNPKLPKEAKPSLEENFINFVHKIVKGADGRQHVVIEQYKVKADGVGIAMKVLGGSASTAKGVIGNMIIYTLSPELTLEKVNFFLKDEIDCTLPPGSGWFGAGMIGLVINMNGGFNYQFTQENNDLTNFSTVYINYKKVKKSKFSEKTLVNIMYSGAPEVTTDKIDVTSNKETFSYVYPAKPGYVLVADNNFTDKKLEMKLVKLNK